MELAVRNLDVRLALRPPVLEKQDEKKRDQKIDRIVPPISELQRLAANIVDDAHRIARERGQNVISIIKELIADMKKDK